MLALETRSNWAGMMASVKVGTPVAEVWTPPATVADAVSAMNALVAWCNDAGRSWYGTAGFVWSWTNDKATRGALLALHDVSGSFIFTAAGTTTALLGLATHTGVVVQATTPADGTWCPGTSGRVPLGAGQRWLRGAGDGSGAGSIRPGVSALAAPVWRSKTTCHALDVARLQVELAASSHPRRGWLRLSTVAIGASEQYVDGDPDFSARWRRVAVGKVATAAAPAGLYNVTADFAGDAV